MSEYNYVCIDTETTGLDPNKDEIIEVCAIEFNEEGNLGGTFYQLCRPISGYISKHASDVNGIIMKDVADKPTYLRDKVREKLAEFVGDRIVVGHNMEGFDKHFLKIKMRKIVDTLVLCRRRFTGRHNLRAACKRVGIKWEEEKAHKAEYDVKKTIELWHYMCGKKKNPIQADLFKKVSGIDPDNLSKLGVDIREEDKTLMETQVYSYSRINLFKQCPLKWYMMYILKIKEDPKDYFDVGNICHAVAEMSGDWCFRQTFANRVEVYMNILKGFTLSDDIVNTTAKYFDIKPEDVTKNHIGLLLHDKPSYIPTVFPGVKGRATLSIKMSPAIASESYEIASMPDRSAFDKIFEKAVAKVRCTDADAIYDAKKIMNRFFERKDFSLALGEIRITEKRLCFDKNWKVMPDFFSKEAFFRCIIDVIEYLGRYVVITDYKSSRKMLTVEQLKEDAQTQVYVLAMKNFLPPESYDTMIVRIEYLRFGESVEYELDKAGVEYVSNQALNWINSSIQEIEAEMLKDKGTAFKPTRNEYCGVCDFNGNGKCPLFDKRMNEMDNPFTFTVSSVEECQMAWKRIEANKAENSRLTKLCKNFVKSTTTPIKIDENAKLDFYLKGTRDYYTKEFVKLMLEKGVDLEYMINFLSINQSDVQALLEKKEISLSDYELDRVSEIKKSYKFEAYTEDEAKGKNYINP